MTLPMLIKVTDGVVDCFFYRLDCVCVNASFLKKRIISRINYFYSTPLCPFFYERSGDLLVPSRASLYGRFSNGRLHPPEVELLR